MTLLPTSHTRTILDEMPSWIEEFNALTHRIAAYFARLEVRHRVAGYLKSLLSPIERKNSWQLAEQAGDTTPYGIQHLLRRAQWDPNAVRDVLRAYVVESLADPKAVVVLDETGFLKKGDKSVGVQRQYSGTAGRVENCQIGVFLVYASSKGHSFIDRELYLPQSWTQDKAKCQEAGVADDISFATKPQLAKQMLARAFEAEVPIGWVSGDSVYGDHRLRRWLEEQQQPYVLGVTSQQALWWQQRAQVLVSELPATAWQCLSAGEGTKGPRCDEWATIRLNTSLGAQWQKWILLRRSLSDSQELAYYAVFAPAGTSMAEVVRVAGARWAIEQCFQTKVSELSIQVSILNNIENILNRPNVR